MLDPEMMRAKNVFVGRVSGGRTQPDVPPGINPIVHGADVGKYTGKVELEDDGRHDIVGGDE